MQPRAGQAWGVLKSFIPCMARKGNAQGCGVCKGARVPMAGSCETQGCAQSDGNVGKMLKIGTPKLAKTTFLSFLPQGS